MPLWWPGSNPGRPRELFLTHVAMSRWTNWPPKLGTNMVVDHCTLNIQTCMIHFYVRSNTLIKMVYHALLYNKCTINYDHICTQVSFAEILAFSRNFCTFFVLEHTYNKVPHDYFDALEVGLMSYLNWQSTLEYRIMVAPPLLIFKKNYIHYGLIWYTTIINFCQDFSKLTFFRENSIHLRLQKKTTTII